MQINKFLQSITWNEFNKIDIRAGTIVRSEPFPEARKSAYKVWIDLGPDLGIKPSSAQITERYSIEQLIGIQVVCIVNLGPKLIAGFTSEVLVTGFEDNEGRVVLTTVQAPVPNGSKLF